MQDAYNFGEWLRGEENNPNEIETFDTTAELRRQMEEINSAGGLEEWQRMQKEKGIPYLEELYPPIMIKDLQKCP